MKRIAHILPVSPEERIALLLNAWEGGLAVLSLPRVEDDPTGALDVELAARCLRAAEKVES